jgi:hypothetical protein
VLAPHRYEMCERCMIEADADTDLGTCKFPDDHAPGHPAEMRFHIYDPTQEVWVEWTEEEIAQFHAEFSMSMLMYSSQFDWWFSP